MALRVSSDRGRPPSLEGPIGGTLAAPPPCWERRASERGRHVGEVAVRRRWQGGSRCFRPPHGPWPPPCSSPLPGLSSSATPRRGTPGDPPFPQKEIPPNSLPEPCHVPVSPLRDSRCLYHHRGEDGMEPSVMWVCTPGSVF